MWLSDITKGKAAGFPLSSRTMVKIFKLWAKHIFSAELLHILKGNYNRVFKKEQWLFDTRYRICSSCENRESVKPIGEICGICGCPLQSKLRVKDEKCDLNKWKQ